MPYFPKFTPKPATSGCGIKVTATLPGALRVLEQTGKPPLNSRVFEGKSITVGYLDMETMNIVDTQMYIDGYQVKLVSDTSYGSLWEVSFTLKEF